MTGMARSVHLSTTGRAAGIARSGRAAGRIIALLLWALVLSQALVVVHGYTHPSTQAAAGCAVCLLGARVAHVPSPLPDPPEPRTLCVPLAAVTPAPYALPLQRTDRARAPPLLPHPSAAV